MAIEIAAHAVDRAQALHETVLALQIVVDLYMDSSRKDIDDMIFIVDYLVGPLVERSDDLMQAVRKVAENAT